MKHEIPKNIKANLSENDLMNLNKTCYSCGEEHIIEVKRKDFNDWNNGKLIQDAFPYQSPGVRELLISGMCEKCFNKMFSPD